MSIATASVSDNENMGGQLWGVPDQWQALTLHSVKRKEEGRMRISEVPAEADVKALVVKFIVKSSMLLFIPLSLLSA